MENLESSKKARLKTGLIDVDLVRGSTFTKPKTRQGLLNLLLSSALALLLFPLRRTWWREKTNGLVYSLGNVGTYLPPELILNSEGIKIE